jgi:NAD-dependent SIR2 family protein deacetylase
MEGERMFSLERKEERNPLLEGPELISPEELEKELKEKLEKGEIGFSFPLETRCYWLGYKESKPFFVIEYFDSLPEELEEKGKEKFTKQIRKFGEVEKVVYVLKYGEAPKLEERVQENLSEKYRIAPARNFEREKIRPLPKEVEISQLAEFLKDKRVLFYTGAGISMASGVPSFNQLQEKLGIEMSQKIDGFLKKAITNPEELMKIWEDFIKATFENPPTPAHCSLAKLAQKLNAQIFTENIDYLQERAGVKAIHISGPWLRENIKPEWLKEIDGVITIGLSYDDRGFLGWYKENNPNGKIIAIDLEQPSYLGNEDFILKGDCQEILPELEEKFA